MVGWRLNYMREYIIQRKIAFVGGIAGLFVAIINLVDDLPKRNFLEAFIDIDVSLVILLSGLFLVSGYINSWTVRLFQIVLALICSGIAILDAYDAIYGLGLIILAVLLSFSYGFFRRHGVIKILFIVLYLFVMVVISTRLGNRSDHIMLGLDAIIYLAMFLVTAYLIYSDEINAYLSRANQAESALETLRAERETLNSRLNELDDKIRAIEARRICIDLDKAGITAREREVLRVLIEYHETEKDIAKRLGISHFTVKEHFRHIRDKLGVDRREEIIELCRDSFSQN